MTRWFMSYRRVQMLQGAAIAPSVAFGACIVDEHPLEWCARHNAHDRYRHVDLIIPLWWSQDIPETFDSEWCVEI